MYVYESLSLSAPSQQCICNMIIIFRYFGVKQRKMPLLSTNVEVFFFALSTKRKKQKTDRPTNQQTDMRVLHREVELPHGPSCASVMSVGRLIGWLVGLSGIISLKGLYL